MRQSKSDGQAWKECSKINMDTDYVPLSLEENWLGLALTHVVTQSVDQKTGRKAVIV